MPFDGTMTLPPGRSATVYDDMKRSRERAEHNRTLARLNATRKAVLVLDRLAVLFADEERWTTGAYRNGNRYCLLGGVRHIRRVVGRGDNAGVFLARAIKARMGRRMAIIRFNDASGYSEVMAVVGEATHLARVCAQRHEKPSGIERR